MKKIKWVTIFFSGILVFFLILYYGFDLRYFVFMNGVAGECDNIKDSKFIGVFLTEYKPENREIFINDKIHFTIKEVWAEKLWFYSNDFRKPVIECAAPVDCQMIVITNDGGLKYHGIVWRFEELNTPTYIQNIGNQLWGGFLYNELKDTMRFKLLKKNAKTHRFTDSIGYVRFFKVRYRY